MPPKRVIFSCSGVLSPQKSKGNVWKMLSLLLLVGGTSPSRLAAVRVSYDFIQKQAGEEKKVCATAFYQILQLSVTGWLLLMIIGSICIAFSSHRSQNTLKRLVEAITGSRLSWTTWHPEGRPPLFPRLRMPPRAEISFDG